MPWSTRKPSATEIAPDWLKLHCREFVQRLADQGYARATMHDEDVCSVSVLAAVLHRAARCSDEDQHEYDRELPRHAPFAAPLSRQ